jgi:iron complex outermembrane receptor protein
MLSKISNYLSIGAIISALVLPGIPAFAQDAADDDTLEEFALEEVIVTAQRREAELQSVPIAISAFTETELDRRQIVSTLDLIRNVPNLVGSNNVGLSSATSLFLRGVGQDESISSQDPAVGTYVDGVYVARQIANNAYLYDIERIEVLRGPQGTLFGRNTSGGAINIITRKPSENVEGEFEGSYGSFESYSLKGRFNAPLSDKVYLNGSIFTAQMDKGYQRNVTLGTRTYEIGRASCRERV